MCACVAQGDVCPYMSHCASFPTSHTQAEAGIFLRCNKKGISINCLFVFFLNGAFKNLTIIFQ